MNEALLQYGALGAFMLYTMYRDYRRDQSAEEYRQRTEQYVRNELTQMWKTTMDAINAISRRPCMAGQPLEDQKKDAA